MKKWNKILIMMLTVCACLLNSGMDVHGALSRENTNSSVYSNASVESKGELPPDNPGSDTPADNPGSEDPSNLPADFPTDAVNEIDMSKVKLESKKFNGCITDRAVPFSGSIKIKSPVELNKNNSTMTYSSNNRKMLIRCEMGTNKLNIKAYSTGSAKLTIKINDKKFNVKVKISKFDMKQKGYVGVKKKSVTLKTKGASGKVKWTSSNKKVAKVSKKGKVRFLKEGNAIITASCGKCKASCAVSVVSLKMLQVIKEAKNIAQGTYSQARRMQPGYYDCSSLVWKAYQKAGKNFGSSGYAPVAAAEAQWCMQNGKVVSMAYTRTDVQKMKLKPGDLLFKTGARNGRFMGIYHVEMFVGYTVSHYDKSGKPVLSELWASRPQGYSSGGYMILRP